MATKRKPKKNKAGVFDIYVDGKHVDKLCAVNEIIAIEEYKKLHPEITGEVTAEWDCPSPTPTQGNCDEFAKKRFKAGL
jgi:hypothetical protein